MHRTLLTILSVALHEQAEQLRQDGQGETAVEKYRAAADAARRATELKQVLPVLFLKSGSTGRLSHSRSWVSG